MSWDALGCPFWSLSGSDLVICSGATARTATNPRQALFSSEGKSCSNCVSSTRRYCFAFCVYIYIYNWSTKDQNRSKWWMYVDIIFIFFKSTGNCNKQELVASASSSPASIDFFPVPLRYLHGSVLSNVFIIYTFKRCFLQLLSENLGRHGIFTFLKAGHDKNDKKQLIPERS